MAAEAAISFAVQKLGDALNKKAVFLRGVEEQVEWLRDELKRMQGFLRDAARKQANDERVRNWISGIKEVAYDAEDAIEIFILKVENATRRRGLVGRVARFPSHVYHLNKVREVIGSIQRRLQDIETRLHRYGIQDLGEGGVDSSRWRSNVERRRQSVYWQQDKDLVGLDEDVELLFQKAILEKTEGLSVAAIVGMGGIGKSTLARKIFNHAVVAKRFDCRAWVVVSSEFTPEETIKQVLLQLQNSEEDRKKVLKDTKELEESTKDKLVLQEKLKEMLHTQLQGKAYFIVLDDVWEHAHWESLRSAFPDEQGIASRLLFTSRNQNITKHHRYIHKMRLLNPEESWELFLKTAFIGETDCKPDLQSIGSEILKKCHGLPLAITIAGGLLVNQGMSRIGWEKVLKQIKNYHLETNEIGSNVSTILELSYQNLPLELKACFLCLSFFKEDDSTIRAEKLVEVWIAEGLVPHDREEMEEIATSYLEELINRNLIQVKDMSKDGRVKNCRVHDLIRELSIRKAKEDISFEILMEEGNSQSSRYKPRHRAIYCSRGRLLSSTNQNKSLYSLFFFFFCKVDDRPSYWKSFELLRVLDFEDFGLEKLPDTIGELIGLRYLGLRNNKIRRLPRSLGRLKKLEVLDIALNFMVEVPNVIWKLSSLRHLYMSGIRCRGPLKTNMKNLQTLLYIPLAHWKPKEMTSLQKLGIELYESSDVSELCKSLAMVPNLVCLKLRGNYNQSMAPMVGLQILGHLTKLKLQGWLLSLPSASDFPPNLSCLSLVHTYLNQDPMPILEKLSNLRYLKLHQAYTGQIMEISKDGFAGLKVLTLRRLLELSNLEVGEGALKELELLEINICPNLERLPERVTALTVKIEWEKLEKTAETKS